MIPEIDPQRLQLLRTALTEDRVCILHESSKDDVLRALIAIIATSPNVTDPAALTSAIFKREALMSTGIGLGLAVPHVRIPSVKSLTMAVGISHAGIDDYSSLDDKPVHHVFLIAAPEGQHAEYLRLLSAISARAKALDKELLQCESPSDLFARITESQTGASEA
jgi:PTS system nitrogen regulatory IIA component